MCSYSMVRPRTTLAALVLVGAGINTAFGELATHTGEAFPLGEGSVNTYIVLKDGNVPVSLGVRMSETALEGLPAEPNHTNRCFDVNGDGTIQGAGECLGDYETVMSWPEAIARTNLPFRWMELDWNAHGHAPPGVYDRPHFDVHFYMVEREAITAIRTGTCGIMVDCQDFERASTPVAADFLPAGYADVGAVVPAMGNHLVNTAAPELATPPTPFTHTLIYGAYDGRITFIEPMVSREYLASRPDVCAPIVQPAKWDAPGSYPTQYCIRHLPGEAALTISLEGFVEHQ